MSFILAKFLPCNSGQLLNLKIVGNISLGLHLPGRIWPSQIVFSYFVAKHPWGSMIHDYLQYNPSCFAVVSFVYPSYLLPKSVFGQKNDNIINLLGVSPRNIGRTAAAVAWPVSSTVASSFSHWICWNMEDPANTDALFEWSLAQAGSSSRSFSGKKILLLETLHNALENESASFEIMAICCPNFCTTFEGKPPFLKVRPHKWLVKFLFAIIDLLDMSTNRNSGGLIIFSPCLLNPQTKASAGLLSWVQVKIQIARGS